MYTSHSSALNRETIALLDYLMYQVEPKDGVRTAGRRTLGRIYTCNVGGEIEEDGDRCFHAKTVSEI